MKSLFFQVEGSDENNYVEYLGTAFVDPAIDSYILAGLEKVKIHAAIRVPLRYP